MRWRNPLRRHTPTFTPAEQRLIQDAAIERARESCTRARHLRGDCNLETVARATANRIHTETRMWLEAANQARYVAMYRAAVRDSHLYIRLTERHEHLDREKAA